MRLMDFSPEHNALIEMMKGQLLIVFVQRLGGKISIPVEEIDGTGMFNLAMKFENGIFTFEVIDKQ